MELHFAVEAIVAVGLVVFGMFISAFLLFLVQLI